jgi:putative heme-binding domain-containing protein
VNSLLGSTNDALALAVACYGESVDDALRTAIADVASRHRDSSVRDLFERFLPEERRVKRLGTSIDANALLAMTGDVAAGRQMFFKSADVNCRQCHKIGDQGVEVGPDLSSVGIQRTPAEILDSILHPSAKIDPKYQGKLVLTVDGAVVSGLVVTENDQSITIVEPSGKARSMNQNEIETIKPLEKSVMPDLMLAEFTAEQAADLLAFLVEQKKPVVADR